MSRRMTVDGIEISDDAPCFVIAEIGHNHQGNVQRAKALFEAAARAGATAVKLQKRDNRALFTREMYEQVYNSENAFGATYGEHREFLEFGVDEYRELQMHAGDLGLAFFATAFDVPSADVLADLEVPAFKIASGDLTNTPLLEHVARLGRPVFVSTGGGTMEDVERAVGVVSRHNEQLCVLQCTAVYPAEPSQLNLRVIQTFRDRFSDVVIGLSSHDNGIAMPLVAYTLGARVVEKHFTLNRAWKGTDHAFSLEEQGLRKMVRDLERARAAMGDDVKRRLPEEVPALVKMAKKVVAARDLPAGHVLSEADLTVKSPGDGMPPFRLSDCLGRKLLQALATDEALDERLLAES